jgi:nicotinamidase-related amidase
MATVKSLALCDSSDSALVLIDIQTRLAVAMSEEARHTVLHQAGILLQAAKLLGVPVLVSEQYPKGLGKLMPSLAHYLPANTPIFEKTRFSLTGVKEFQTTLKKLNRSQLILVGMETHVCILQSALQLKKAGRQVFVVEDAVCSRTIGHHQNALGRLHAGGVTITNAESVLFEWLRDAKHEHFKNIAALIR